MSTSTSYARHISFDDLAPSLIDDQAKIIRETSQHIGFYNHFIKVPPQYNPAYRNAVGSGDASPLRQQNHELDSRKLTSKLDGMHLAPRGRSALGTSNRSRSVSPFIHSPKVTNAPRLPPPPEQKILKMKEIKVDEPVEIEDIDISDVDPNLEKHIKKVTESNTQTNSGSNHGYTQNAFSNLNELEDRIDVKNNKTSQPPVGEEKKRSKSFAGMTDAELAQLEDFYTSQARSTSVSNQMNNFDFGKQIPVFFDDSKKNNNVNANLALESLAAIYPTRPTITYKSMSLNSQHPEYTAFMKKMRKHVPCREKEHTIDYRTIMCYISGRRYTWSSVDWYIENVAADGDHLVIVSRVPEFEKELETLCNQEKRKSKLQQRNSDRSDRISVYSESHTLSSTPSSDPDAVTPSTIGFRAEAIRDRAREVCRELLDYYAYRLKDKITKITVEIVKSDSTKDAITGAAGVYAPNFQIISTVSTNTQIKFRNGNVKLPFFVLKHYPMPTFLIPFEFIDPSLLDKDYLSPESHGSVKVSYVDDYERVDLDSRLTWLDQVIKKTTKNPYAQNSDKPIDPICDSDSEAESVASFTGDLPIQDKKRYEEFEHLGYVMPAPMRQLLAKRSKLVYDIDGKRLAPDNTSRGSGRSSRLYLNDGGMYRVKSMVDSVQTSETDGENDRSKMNQNTLNNTGIRKVKSSGGPIFLTPPMPGSTNRPPKGRKHSDTSLKKAKSHDPTSKSSTPLSLPRASSNGKSKKTDSSKNSSSSSSKKSIGSMFKKVFW
ncbi:uncharacterized protein GVI51_F07535 [Nakaseomyces glabratus]|uniref:Uncharacterized protein n=2 Tax=Candida glabrata TaxID=5478 RepID=Q6FTX9_CANGA|nr:uncharacterized protein CAGL0F07975g [Nakaseomyces glabratus]KAH7587805.1 hypothetical protein J7298_01574 [Nakaseomyces glabratus]KAH7604289.1 hypothetical protein J7295_01581 [Nakaseomyces glabratus]KAH7605274.1 hypothetical protein J7294_01567 [Nakaseomyces glabratus]KAH7607204.1 hypothetical protein J7293_01563 [Nakaseomyces glabratus]KAH7614281.1 hypothetical protein J7292_01555 [Nakaseomyces glabratus]|eukprot:XP_446315.1 uncharacterized protein CAGL0F07975g [[Candida] glabrata]